MLRSLNIRDMLIIRQLNIDFQSGLNVLTGETGAGKSILLDSLGFVLGWRGRAELVRQGADQGEVTAVFDLHPDHPAHAILAEAGLSSDRELILRRVNTHDGRKTSYINDRRCSGEVLRRISDTLIELHGQHDDRGLLDPKRHLQMLDSFARCEDRTATCQSAWRDLARARRALVVAQETVASAQADEDFMRHSLEEITRLDPQKGEDATLDARRRMMQGAGKIRDDILRGFEALGPQGAEGNMGNALRWLEGVQGSAEGELDVPLAALSRAMNELGEAQNGIDRFLEKLSFNPSELEELEERLFALRAIARKHGITPDDIPDFATELGQKLEALTKGSAGLDDLEAAVETAQADYHAIATELRTIRQAAAKELDQAMITELAPLKLERAVFETHLEPAEPGPDGHDEVAFRVATNPGAPAGALNKIASGGELSRFMLALKVCLSAGQSGVTMIFDEIDRGVGGATADSVGRRLAQMGQGAQVLVVTHSPQVAARGDAHWRVEKLVEEDQTFSNVLRLAPVDRVDEIARMLSGDVITKEARNAARALLQA